VFCSILRRSGSAAQAVGEVEQRLGEFVVGPNASSGVGELLRGRVVLALGGELLRLRDRARDLASVLASSASARTAWSKWAPTTARLGSQTIGVWCWALNSSKCACDAVGVARAAGEHVEHTGHGDLMPGMLTDDELAQLEAASGRRFDRLFLQSMIRHRDGAVTMVEQLLTGGQGGQESQLFQLAQHVEVDQQVEIARMKQLLTEVVADR
jgi:hypothetical protein